MTVAAPHIVESAKLLLAILVPLLGSVAVMLTGEKRAKNRSKPKYLTDPVRRIELRATRKLERHFADRTGDHGVAP